MEDTTRMHRSAAESVGPVPVAVVTVSDSRSQDTDLSGGYLRDAVVEAGHRIVAYHIIPDDPDGLRQLVLALVHGDPDVVLVNGGTGLSRRDHTFEVLEGLYERVIPGFGDLFRMLSYEQVGAAAMLSRASAGIIGGKVVFSMPGSPKAVRLAWEKLIQPDVKHVLRELRR